MKIISISKFLWAMLSLLTIARGIESVDCPPPCDCRWKLDELFVDCSNSALVEVPDFRDLPVAHLDLSRNALNTFPDQLASLSNLSYLDLSYNAISYLDHDIMIGFNTLQTLLLANNSLQNWSDILPGKVFRDAIRLEYLSLSGNSFGRIIDNEPMDVLVSDSLKYLHLEACDIMEINGGAITNGLPNLMELNLSKNRIGSMKGLGSNSLINLQLNDCRLEYIDLRYLPKLENLELGWNSNLKPEIFADVPNDNVLNSLNLSYCNLENIDLSKLVNLKKLALSGNLLRSLSENIISNNSELELIDLSRNSLRVIDASTFNFLPKLKQVDLSYNEISALDSKTFYSNKFLAQLDLSHNVFEEITAITSDSIEEINLSWCQITKIHRNAFDELSRLRNLVLSNNVLPNIPDSIRSATLQNLDLSNCKLSNIRNNTFRGFPELVALHLNGNRFTTSFLPTYFASNPLLKDIWIGDNPWICSCHDPSFIEFNGFVNEIPAKLKDKYNTRCASPAIFYGKTWETACADVWAPESTKESSNAWSGILIVIVLVGAFFLFCSCVKRCMRSRKERREESEYQNNTEEMRQIRRNNQAILNETGTPNAPDAATETTLPSYEDAIRMPKPVRPVKSMDDLSSAGKARKQRQQSTNHDPDAEVILLDNKQRYHSQEMLSNRNKERTNPIDPFRRTGRIHYNTSSRNLLAEEGRYPSSRLKQQNMQSAEKISNFQGNEYSPYTKRKPRIAEIPPFKRAILRSSDNVEFLSDPDLNVNSAKNSPFARRKPKSPMTDTCLDMLVCDHASPSNSQLYPVVEDYFGSKTTKSSSSSLGSSDYQILVEADITSIPEGSDEFIRIPNRNRNEQENNTNNESKSLLEQSPMDEKAKKLAHETLF